MVVVMMMKDAMALYRDIERGIEHRVLKVIPKKAIYRAPINLQNHPLATVWLVLMLRPDSNVLQDVTE